MRYRCYYMNKIIGKVEIVDSDKMSDLTDGFWINQDFFLTKGSDCAFWIPPSQIHYIAKVE